MTILSEKQQRLLTELAGEKIITDHFYFGGGTVLAEYYLHHRYSEDLDFFSEDEFDPSVVSTVLKKIRAKTKITDVRFEQSFNRNLFFLNIGDETIKTEFTFFPFPRIESGEVRGLMPIDSLIDIAVNKVFTIFQKPRSRDFVDLYCIIQKQGWTMSDLTHKAQVKFDTYIDPIQLGAQFVRADEAKDYPRLRIDLAPKVWQEFFHDEAKKLRTEVLE